jgi:outer membrane autotransporter protein
MNMNMNMNKYKSGIITIPGLLLSSQLQAITLGFFPSSANVTVGDPFSVELRISDIDNNSAIGDYDLNINFESSSLSIIPREGEGVVFGNELRQSGVESLRDVNLVGNGQLNIAEVSLNSAGDLNALQSDEFTVATLNFTADAPGVSQLDVDVSDIVLGNQAGLPINSTNNPVRVIPASIVVQQDQQNLSVLTELQVDAAQVLGGVCSGLMQNQGDLRGNSGDLATIACSVTAMTGDVEMDSEVLGSTFQNLAGEETIAPANLAVQATISQSHILRTQLANRRNSNKTAASVPNLKALQGDGFLSLAALGLDDASGGSAGNDDSLASSERLGGFIDATANFGETDQTSRENATHFNKEEVTVGVDYQFTDQFVSGLAVTYSNANANFQQSTNVSGGKAAEQGYSGSIYSTYYLDDLYVDGIFTYTKRDYDIERNIIIPSQNIRRKAKGDPESDQYAASLGLGYSLQMQGFDLNPYAQVSYTRLEIESYSERGAGSLNLNIDNQDVESLESVLGARLAYVWSQPFGVLMPQFKAEWHHEFKENSRTIKTSFVSDINNAQNILTVRTDKPDRDFAIIGIGLSGVFQGGLQVFAAFETLLAQENTSSHKFTAGLRLPF